MPSAVHINSEERYELKYLAKPISGSCWRKGLRLLQNRDKLLIRPFLSYAKVSYNKNNLRTLGHSRIPSDTPKDVGHATLAMEILTRQRSIVSGFFNQEPYISAKMKLAILFIAVEATSNTIELRLSIKVDMIIKMNKTPFPKQRLLVQYEAANEGVTIQDNTGDIEYGHSDKEGTFSEVRCNTSNAAFEVLGERTSEWV